MLKKTVGIFNKWINFIDSHPLWWVCLVMFIIMLLPHLALGTGSVFDVHDQMDESMMNYVLTARHFGEATIPEMMCGINASGLAPSAILFIPLFQIFSPFYAMLIAYFILFFVGFLGMYLLVNELTESSILSLLSAGLFSMLPFYPVYGLSEMGIPMMLYVGICLYKRKNRVFSYLFIALFALTSHLVYTGYVVLFFWLISIAVSLISTKKMNWFLSAGFLELTFLYCIVNIQLISEILLGNSSYVSHREEMVNYSQPFFKSVQDVFMNGQPHAPSYHWGMFIPLVILLIMGGVFFRKLTREAKNRYIWAVCIFSMILLIALFYGFCKTDLVVGLQNQAKGFLHYFQFDRFYWIGPALWYLEFALAVSVFWTEAKAKLDEKGKIFWVRNLILYSIIIFLIIFPTANNVLHNSIFYRNVNQYNNGSEVTSYISWKSFYAEDLMQEIEEVIGKDKNTYKIAHLGINPAPALMHGFYTIDGYSNNYPLEYKHSFRRIIAKELGKREDARIYFDEWGNRCYLFNSITGANWMLKKGNGEKYSGLEFDMSAMKELGCEYIFSGAEITDAEQMGLEYLGYYETESSYWGIWLYAII